jgi:hypothetical protein
VYVRNAETLLCGSKDTHDAFLAAFGQQDVPGLTESGPPSAPLVLLGGVSINERDGAHAVGRPQRQLQPGLAGGAGREDDGDPESDDALRPRPGAAPGLSL